MGSNILKLIPHNLDDVVNKQVDAKFLPKEFKVHIKHSENEIAFENLLKEIDQTKN